jgi:hypothetical protein
MAFDHLLTSREFLGDCLVMKGSQNQLRLDRLNAILQPKARQWGLSANRWMVGRITVDPRA